MIALTYFPGLTQPQGKRVRTTWPKLVERLSVPRISPDKHDVPGFSLATFQGDRRALANVEQVFALGLDLDKSVDLSDVQHRFSAVAGFVHTTWSSTIAVPRCRVFLLLSRPVTGEEYRRVYQATVAKCEAGGLVVDRAASDPSRFWFVPSIPAEGCAFVYWTCKGGPVDVDAALAAVPPPAPPPPPSPRPLATGGPSAFDRARAYIAKCEPAIQGSDGSGTTFVIAQRMTRGFMLSVDDAMTLMADWNQRCKPPWSERDLRRKVEQAASLGRMAEGDMLERDRAR